MPEISRKSKQIQHTVKHLFKGKKPDNKLTRTLERLATKFGLPFGIFLAISIALTMTFGSMLLYVVSGTSKLDLSRPGYESARQQIRHDVESDRSFPASGVIDERVIDDFLSRFDRETKNLQQYDSFNQSILDDAQLGITDQPTAPTDGANP